MAWRAADPRVAVIMMTAYTRDELVAESERMTGFGASIARVPAIGRRGWRGRLTGPAVESLLRHLAQA
jgi:hypothetical protein